MRADATDAPELNDRAQEKSLLYDAFISYDHDDRAVAAGGRLPSKIWGGNGMTSVTKLACSRRLVCFV